MGGQLCLWGNSNAKSFESVVVPVWLWLTLGKGRYQQTDYSWFAVAAVFLCGNLKIHITKKSAVNLLLAAFTSCDPFAINHVFFQEILVSATLEANTICRVF